MRQRLAARTRLVRSSQGSSATARILFQWLAHGLGEGRKVAILEVHQGLEGFVDGEGGPWRERSNTAMSMESFRSARCSITFSFLASRSRGEAQLAVPVGPGAGGEPARLGLLQHRFNIADLHHLGDHPLRPAERILC
jgi:hypothetical protein